MFSLLVGYQYRSAAVVTDEPAPADPDIVSLVRVLRGRPGTRVPHVWLRRGGQRVSTLDLLGPGFTVLTGGDGARWQDAVSRASNALGIPLAVHRIGADGWAHATGLGPDGALLVRPDDFVGWRTETLPADPETALQKSLSAILDR